MVDTTKTKKLKISLTSVFLVSSKVLRSLVLSWKNAICRCLFSSDEERTTFETFQQHARFAFNLSWFGHVFLIAQDKLQSGLRLKNEPQPQPHSQPQLQNRNTPNF